jgi:hypothetical protein
LTCRITRLRKSLAFVRYQTEGVEGLKALHSCRPTSALQAQATTLEVHFRDKPVSSCVSCPYARVKYKQQVQN